MKQTTSHFCTTCISDKANPRLKGASSPQRHVHTSANREITEPNVISVLLPWYKVIRVWKPILSRNRALQKYVSIVRSAVKQYRVSILLILSLKFLFPSHSVTKCRFCSWCRATVSEGSLCAEVIPGMPSMVVKYETEILPVCDGGLKARCGFLFFRWRRCRVP